MSEPEHTILVTGGAGFIGSNFVLEQVLSFYTKVVNLDLLTYAGNTQNLKELSGNSNHIFIKGDIGNRDLVEEICKKYKPEAIINFAAESHVDRSIADPGSFINTNIMGTYNLLEASRSYYNKLSQEEKNTFRFLHVSTDEVYGSLEQTDPAFTEASPYQPNSPYSASKAASDHLARAWYHTYNFPTIITNCSNNYGPYQFPEKLIPLIICNALEGKLLPIYGKGTNIRDWLFVKDHCEALRIILKTGKLGQTYNIGGNNEKTNLEVVQTICTLLDKAVPIKARNLHHPNTAELLTSYSELINFVPDRPGHDARYAINSNKMQKELGWYPKESFETGIAKTVKWYIQNQKWINNIKVMQKVE